MKTTCLSAVAIAFIFTACDVKVTPPKGDTTIINPPAEKKVENNTTIVNPPAKETKNTTTTTVTGPGGSVTKEKTSETK
jgi:hypothetical protein